MDEPEEASQKRRLSLQGLGAVERSLKPEMVAHVVDALFDKCALAANNAPSLSTSSDG